MVEYNQDRHSSGELTAADKHGINIAIFSMAASGVGEYFQNNVEDFAAKAEVQWDLPGLYEAALSVPDAKAVGLSAAVVSGMTLFSAARRRRCEASDEAVPQPIIEPPKSPARQIVEKVAGYGVAAGAAYGAYKAGTEMDQMKDIVSSIGILGAGALNRYHTETTLFGR